MANLPAIIRATRASAAALARMQKHRRALHASRYVHDQRKAQRAYNRACADYDRAQAILADNPL